MPTANSAAPTQPIQRSMSRYRRLVLQALGVAVGLALLAPAQAALPQSANAAASPACNGWDSTSRPPKFVEALRRVPGALQKKCCTEVNTFVESTVQEPPENVAVKVPVPDPAGTWLFTKCQVPAMSPQDCP